jgi:hypothetical protein
VLALLASAAPASAAADPARMVPAPSVTVERAIVPALGAPPEAVDVVAGPLAAWTVRGRLHVGGDGPPRAVAPGLRLTLWDVGRARGGRAVALGLSGARSRPAVVALRDGRRAWLRTPKRVGKVTAGAVDGGRILLATSGAKGAAGRPALWVGRLGERGDVRGLRRWRYGPRHTVATGMTARAGWITVDTYDDRYDDETESGERYESFAATTGGRWHTLGSARTSVSAERDYISANGVLPGSRWVLMTSSGEGGSSMYLTTVTGDREARLRADEQFGRMLDLSARMALDDAGRLVVVNGNHAADPDPDYGGPATVRSIVRSTPLVVPAPAGGAGSP